MRNPYIVGRWLCGDDHYGRQRLLEYLINVEDPAIWVVGTRRMGKTSLLRQLEWLTDSVGHAVASPVAGWPGSALVPLFWDLQGCESVEDLDYELFVSVEDESERFEALGIDVSQLEGMEVPRMLRTLQRFLRQANKQLFLLIDETEALINVAQKDTQFLARLRKIFQSGNQRTVMVSTKSLMQLNDLSSHWLTSPFLFGVSLVNLWNLDADASRDLVLQKQASHEMSVDSTLVEEILVHTHRHPYLIQYLCNRLFESLGENRGTLRAIENEDLHPDHLLAGFFQIDFEHLAPIERQILLTVARHGLIDEETLCAELGGELPNRISMFTYGMNKLGYLRSVYGQWSLGNEFLRRWVMENYQSLIHNVQSQVTDHGVESLLVAGRHQERSYLQQELATRQAELYELLAERASYEADVPLEISTRIQDLRRETNDLAEQLNQLDATPIHVSPGGTVAD